MSQRRIRRTLRGPGPRASQAGAVRRYLSRQAGRVVLVSPQCSVLLLSGTDPADRTAPPFWFVPGGGAENGETPEQAARREVYEEVGADLVQLGPVVWRRRTSFAFNGDWYDQDECFFVVRTALFEPRPIALTDLERSATTGSRWWALSELAASEEAVYPSGLARFVQDWLDKGPPDVPLLID